MPETFPIMHSTVRKTIPWTVIARHEPQAWKNHYQSLVRLAERGGLSPCEAIAVIEGRRWSEMDLHEAERRLDAAIAAENRQGKRCVQTAGPAQCEGI